MLTDESIAKEFLAIVAKVYPSVSRLLQHCRVRIVHSFWGDPPRRLHYVAVYCPEDLVAAVQSQHEPMKEIAENMGLSTVICINATRLLRDPHSKLQSADPRFWLELSWLVTDRHPPKVE